jgi:hypothetical protein
VLKLPCVPEIAGKILMDKSRQYKRKLVPGSLDKKGGRRCHLLLNKR